MPAVAVGREVRSPTVRTMLPSTLSSMSRKHNSGLNFLVSSRPEGVSRPGTAARIVETDITRIIPSGRFRRGRRAAAAPRPATPPSPRPVARGSASAGLFATASTRPASATSTTGSRRTTAAATRPASGGGASTRSKLCLCALSYTPHAEVLVQVREAHFYYLVARSVITNIYTLNRGLREGRRGRILGAAMGHGQP